MTKTEQEIVRESPARYRNHGQTRGAFETEGRSRGQAVQVETEIGIADLADCRMLLEGGLIPNIDLGPNPTGLVVRDRKMWLDGKPAKLASSWIPLDIAEGTRIMTPDTGPGGTFARLAELGHEVVRISEQVRVIHLADYAAAAEFLGKVTAFDIVRFAFDRSGRMIETTREIFPTESHMLSYEIPLT